jgi:hypothetical protein
VAAGAAVGDTVEIVGDPVGVGVGGVVYDGHAAPTQSQKSPVHPAAHPAV